jgi:hypothetical protein
MTQPLKKRSEGRKKWVKGLDNSGNIEGISVRPGNAGQLGLEDMMPP